MLKSYQPGARDGVMPELPARVKARQDRPDGDPSTDQHQGFFDIDAEQPTDRQGRQKPQPTQGVAQQGTRLADVVALKVSDANIPSFHGQRLAVCPKPNEVNTEHQEQKCLLPMPVVHGVAGLCQGAEKIVGYEHHAEHQQSLVKPTGHASAQRRSFEFIKHESAVCWVMTDPTSVPDFGWLCRSRCRAVTQWPVVMVLSLPAEESAGILGGLAVTAAGAGNVASFF